MRTTSSDVDAGQFENTQWPTGHRIPVPQTVTFVLRYCYSMRTVVLRIYMLYRLIKLVSSNV